MRGLDFVSKDAAPRKEIGSPFGMCGIPELTKMECKGMVQYLQQTYRIMKISQRSYEVIRILDDVQIGEFELGSKLCVHPNGVTHELLLQIAITALKQATVSWTGTSARRPLDGMVPPAARDSADCIS